MLFSANINWSAHKYRNSKKSCSWFYRFRLFIFLVLQIAAFHVPCFTDSGFSCSWFYRFRLFTFLALRIPAFMFLVLQLRLFMFLVLQIPPFHVPGFLVPCSVPLSVARFPVPCFTDSLGTCLKK